jgi:hypothetical protein
MAEDGDEDAAFAFLNGPDHRPGFALFIGFGEHIHVFRIADHRPIGFIDEMHRARKAAQNRVVGTGGEVEVKSAVTVFAAARLKGEADAFGEIFRLFVRDRSGVQDHESAAPLEERVELLVLLVRPVMVPVIDEKGIGVLELLGRGPFPCGGDLDAFRPWEQLAPIGLPCGIVVFARAMVLFAGDEGEFDRARVGQWLGFAKSGFDFGGRAFGRRFLRGIQIRSSRYDDKERPKFSHCAIDALFVGTDNSIHGKLPAMIGLRKLLAMTSLMSCVIASAQEPKINSCTPGAITPGKPTEITFSGENLGGMQEVWLNFAGRTSVVKAEEKSALVRFELEKDTPCGVGALRVASSNGVSALQLLMIDDLASVSESGSNQTFAAAAQKISLPVAIDGVCNEAGFDFFRFAAKKGQTLSIETVAQRLGSLADTVIRILDEQGKEVAFCDDGGASRDSRFIFKAPASDQYVLELRDMSYGGGEGYRYRLRIGEFPLITAVFPPAIQQGKTETIHWLGPDVHGLKPQKGAPGMVSASRKGQSGFATVIRSDSEEAVEVEPNDNIEAANRIGSGGVSGRFEKDADRDVFQFEARKDQRLVFEAATRSLNSPCDALMRILKADGSQIAQSHEGTMTNTFKEDGTYFMELRELTGKGATDFVYRLEIKPLERGFELSAESDHFEIKDGKLALKITCFRHDYAGPVTLAAKNDWFTLEDNVIAEKKTNTVLKLSPKEACPRGEILQLRITGTARIGEREVTERVGTAAALRRLWPRMAVLPPELDEEIAAWVPTEAKASP